MRIRPDAEKVFASAMVGAMEELGVYLVGRVRILINRGNRLGLTPSRPGEPPRKVTGRLFKSIASALVIDDEGLALLVGSNVHYARPLELGETGVETVREHYRRGRIRVREHQRRYVRLPRPYLRRAIIESRQVVGRIVAAHLLRQAGGA